MSPQGPLCFPNSVALKRCDLGSWWSCEALAISETGHHRKVILFGLSFHLFGHLRHSAPPPERTTAPASASALRRHHLNDEMVAIWSHYFFFLHLLIYLYLFIYRRVECTHVEVRGLVAGVGSLHFPCGSQGSDSGSHSWQHTLFPSEPPPGALKSSSFEVGSYEATDNRIRVYPQIWRHLGFFCLFSFSRIWLPVNMFSGTDGWRGTLIFLPSFLFTIKLFSLKTQIFQLEWI